MIWRTRGIRRQLTFLYVLAFGAFLIVFSAIIFANYNRTILKEFDAALYNYTIEVANNIGFDPLGNLHVSNEILNEHLKAFPFPLGESYVQLRTLDGRSLLRSRSLGQGQLPFDEQMVEEVKENRVYFANYIGVYTSEKSKTQNSYRQINFMMKKDPIRLPLILQVSVPMTLVEKQKVGFFSLMGFSIPAFLFFATLAGLYLSKKAMEPVRQMAEKAKLIGVTDLSQRIPVPDTEDEIQNLAKTFNRLLDRLEKAFISQERFISNASHQLKTPLSIMRGELDVLRQKNRSPEEVQEFLESASSEIDHLSKLVQELLLLARVEAGKESIPFTDLQMDELVLDSVRRLQKFADKQKVQLRFNLEEEDSGSEIASGRVRGDEHLLRCLIENLIENAIKYSPEGKIVEIRVRSHTQSVEVWVRDEGPGISDAQKEKVFERFNRGEMANKGIEGVGLGLAIANKIAELHGGKLSLDSEVGKGSLFRAQFPTSGILI